MSAKRCGLASLLLNIKGLPPRFTKLVSFAVSGEFYFTSLLLGFPRRLVVVRKPIFRLTARNEVITPVEVIVRSTQTNKLETIVLDDSSVREALCVQGEDPCKEDVDVL